MNKEMEHLLYKCLGLIFTVILSFISISSYEYPTRGNDYDKSLDIIRLMMPGLIYTLYLILISFKDLTFTKGLLSFVLYLLFYAASLMLSLASWGFIVPIAGSLGGIFTKILFFKGGKWNDNESILFGKVGFIISAIGLILFFILKDFFTIGVGFGIIIAFWQLAIGITYIWRLVSRSF